jgi:hypothetical protein
MTHGGKQKLLLLALIATAFLSWEVGKLAAQTWQKVVPSGGGCSGSSAPTYLGVTSSSYDGTGVGGYIGANAKCVAQYGTGARFMNVKDKQKNRATNYPADGWIDVRGSYQININNYLVLDEYGTTNLSFISATCNQWTNFGNSGSILKIDGSLSFIGCSTLTPIHCVRD